MDQVYLKKNLSEFEVKHSSLGEKVKFVINNSNLHPSDWNAAKLRKFLLDKKWIEPEVDELDIVYEANLLFGFIKSNRLLPRRLPYEFRKRKG